MYTYAEVITSLCVASDTAPALSLQRAPSSSSTVQGVPLVPLLSSLSYVSSFDTAPPPQDLLAGLLYTAPPPSTGDAKSLASPRPHLDHGLPWSTLLWIGLIPDTYAPTIRTNSLLATCAFRPMTIASIVARFTLWSGSLDLILNAVVHCGPGINNHSVDTLDTHVDASTFTPDLGVISRNLLDIDHAKLPLDGVSPVEHSVMGLNAQEAGRPLVHMEGAQVSGDQTDRRGEAVDLAGTGSKHGRSTVSMETMDEEACITNSHAKKDQAHMQGGLSAYARRAKRICEEGQAPPRGGPSSRSMQTRATQGSER
ncbi:uncharacterized protein UHOD_12211 [Ustilago sp. UG-2017b]|nr:uncharacterized protein UHOD_12211 [Ustilago sp. UG-2017b]